MAGPQGHQSCRTVTAGHRANTCIGTRRGGGKRLIVRKSRALRAPRPRKVAARIVIGSECTHATLNNLRDRRVCVMCDCEGCEAELLDPLKVPALARWDILVELHDCHRPGITATVIERFSATHHIELIDSVQHNPEDFPQASFLRSRQDRLIAVSDLRGSWQQWAWMRARCPTC